MKVSILDYAARDDGMNSQEAFQATTELAQEADRLGYHRFWIAEHHNVPVLATSAPEILMAHLANKTTHIRIGSGGVMLPNYSSYKVAEVFKTLEALHPGRIDAGVGNSPGGDKVVSKALNEGKIGPPNYADQVDDLAGFLTDSLPKGHAYKNKRARPIIESTPEMFILAASGRNSEVAARNGSGFVYAHFIRPDVVAGREAINEYRDAFTPTKLAAKSNAIVAVFALVGETKEDAEDMLRAFELWHVSSVSRTRAVYHMPTPEKASNVTYTEDEQKALTATHQRVIYGTAEEVKQQLLDLQKAYGADEVMIIPNAYSIEKRKQTIRLLAEVL